MKRLIAMLLVCLMLVQMLPLGIHTHAEEMETAETEAAVLETEAAETEEIPETSEVPETTEAPEEIPETTAEQTVAEEAAEEAATVLELPVDPDAERAQTICVTMQNVDGNWVMTDAVEVELPEGFDLSAEGAITPSAVGDNSVTEKENNNSQSTANVVYDDYTVSGTLSSSDLLDYFTFNLTSKSEVIIVAVAKYSSFMMGIWDSYDECIGADTNGEYTSSGNWSYNLYGTISSGRYYLCMLDADKYSNTYMFYITITPVSTTCSHSSYTSVVTAPTCGAQGYTTYTCKSCGYTWKGNYTDATGHVNYTTVVTSPTCGAQGYTTYTCSDCGETWDGNYTDPTGNHTYTDDSDTTCNVCGQVRETSVASGTCGDNLTWVLDLNGTLTITGTGYMYNYANYGTNRMPWNDHAKSIKKIVINNGATSIGEFAFYYCTKVESISIPEGVDFIGKSAFMSCSSLKEVVLPESMEVIGENAFYDCDALTSIAIPAKVTAIGEDAFCSCKRMTGIWVASDNANYASDSSGVLFNKTKTILWRAPALLSGHYDVPSTVKTIAPSAFSQCEVLTSVSMPSCVAMIGAGAFEYCFKLNDVVIPDAVTVLDGSTFSNCSSLTNVKLSANLTAIDGHEFSYSGLTSITIPAKVESISYYAFAKCTNLKEVVFQGNAPEILENAFYQTTTTAKYPVGNYTWTSDVMQDYGGTITWVGTCTNHNAVTVPGKAATCTEDGLTDGQRCSICNAVLVEQEVIPALGHSEVTIPAVVPTCTETGLTEGKKCSLCGEILVKQLVLSALGHDVAVLEAVAPTCTEDGKTEGSYCKRCLEVLVPQQAVPALGHNPVTDAAVEPDCVNTGKTEGSHCSRCQTVLVPQEVIPALGHIEVIDAAVAPTCTETGLTEGKHCSRCSQVLVAQTVVDALGHDEVIDSAAVEPTCVDTGLTKASHCGRCDAVLAIQEVVPALGHVEIIDEAKEPTCVDTGLTEGKHCDRCAEVLIAQEEIPALGHKSVVDAYLAPTCEETGLTEGSHCEVCEEILVAQEDIPALGHTYEDHWCTVCGKSEFVEVISIESDKLEIGNGEQANLTAILDYPIREDTEIVWTLSEGADAYVTIETNRDTAVLTAKRLLQDATVTVSAETAEGLYEPVSIQLTIKAVKADYELFAGKSLTLKPINPATGKAYTSKQLTWSLDEAYEPFVKLAKGKVTAQKVVEKARVEVVATVNATEEKLRYVIDIFPAVTQLEVQKDGQVVNGKTVLMDFSEEKLVLTADLFPADLTQTVTWTVSDSKKQQYASYEIEGNTLTITAPKGKAGTVTVKATITAGVKKNVTVKVQFGSFAKTVAISDPVKTTLRGGEKLNLAAFVTEPRVVSKPGFTWTTSNKAAATVSNGKVTAKNVAHPTVVTITATSKDGQASDSIELEILPKNEGQLVLMAGESFVTNTTKSMNMGESYAVSAAVITGGEPVSNEATWTSSKETVAYVENGVIYATGVGSAKITAEFGGMKAVINVKVATLVDAMEITTKDGKNIIDENGEKVILVSSGKGVNLVANVLTGGANKTVTWSLTEGAEYAKIASSGKLTANKDLTKVVYVTVTATAKDGSGYATSVRVKILPLATGVQIFQNGTRVRSNTVYICDMLTSPVVKLNAKVYPAKANQAVQLTSSNKKIADFNENGDLVCFKPGTVTITAKALDGSNAKTTFKVTVIKRISSLSLKSDVALDLNGNVFVNGGKSLKLATMVEFSPSDATNKKLTWKVAPNNYGITISTSGVLKTKKVTEPVTVNVMAITQDGSGIMLSFNVTVYPA